MVDQGLQTSLLQQQRLSPQMQQSLQFLQVPTLELQGLIQQELLENPVLEVEANEVSLEESGLDRDGEDDGGDDGFEDEFAALAAADDDWQELVAASRRLSKRDGDDEAHQYQLDSLIDPVTLQEHLREQLVMAAPEERVREASEFLIGNIDDNGYLQSSVSELSLAHSIPVAPLKEALELVQSFEPAGVGAVDLRECLMLQLERQGRMASLEYRVVSKHLEELGKHRYPQIARKLGVSTEQVSRAAEGVAGLDPRPGQAFGAGASPVVTPDVTVSRDGDEWVVTLNDDRLPQLRISNVYKDLMGQSKNGDEVRGYIRDKIRSGKFLIKSIHQRQQTIRGIATEIVKRQQQFLEEGSAQLRPMTMAQVAEAVGVHETTVSRAVSGKYISTPHGVFEMKYFFTHGIKTDSGTALSNTSVKGAIADLVKHEDSSKPYSDEHIAKQLKERGIRIARRTVAKYREELNILPSHLRRGY